MSHHPAFDASALLFPSLCIWWVGMYISFRITRSIGISFLVATVKALIFFMYFHFFFTGYFTLLDDWTYFSTAAAVKHQGYTLLSFLIHNRFNWLLLASISGSEHFLYNLYNLLSFDIFGIYYFSPVALNIILTFFIGWIAYRMALLAGFKQKIAIIFYLFFILHGDIILWSSILNLKDTLVQLFTIIILYHLLLIELKRARFRSYIYIGIVVGLLFFIRFYLPFFLAMSFVTYKLYFFIRKHARKPYVVSLLMVTVPLFLLFTFLFLNSYPAANVSAYLQNLTNPLVGILRYIFTPLPFHATEHYEFLNLASPIDFLLFPLFFYGIYYGWKTGQKIFILLIIYLSFLCLFYGTFAELQGVRQKVQIYFIFILFQFVGILKLFFKLRDKQIFTYVVHRYLGSAST